MHGVSRERIVKEEHLLHDIPQMSEWNYENPECTFILIKFSVFAMGVSVGGEGNLGRTTGTDERPVISKPSTLIYLDVEK